MRDKYIEERYKRWFIFGEKDGLVDISDSEGDILTLVPRELANQIIAERDKYVDKMVAYWKVRPEEFYQLHR